MLLLSKAVDAQAQTGGKNVFGCYFLVPIEFPGIDTKDVNDQLTAQGFPAPKYPKAIMGGGLLFYFNRFVATCSYNMTAREQVNGRYLTEVAYRSTTVNVGYTLTQSLRYSIYPFTGFKLSGFHYHHGEKAINPGAFDSHFQNNPDNKKLTNTRAHLDLGIGIARQRFCMLSARLGYLLPLEKVKWKRNDFQTTQAGSPTINYQYYLTLAIGFGRMTGDKVPKRKIIFR